MEPGSQVLEQTCTRSDRWARLLAACCMPPPTLWLLSLASMMAIGILGFVIKDVIGTLGFATGNELSPDDDGSFSESDLLADLHHPVPARGRFTTGLMNLEQISRSLRSFLFIRFVGIALARSYSRSEDLIFRLAPWRMWSTSTCFCLSRTRYITR
jgi:hypothetical protein